jgi:Protein of unknown function (DUF4236)
MGMSFKIAPGVRIRASSRGISAGVGPRAARVHVGTRGVGVSSGVGPFATYSHLGGSRRSPGVASGTTYRGPTKASVAAYERELRAAERQADIEKIAAMEKALVSVHSQSFPKAARVELPPLDDVDPEPIRADLEEKAGIPDLTAEVGGGQSPPAAPPPEPVDRYALMREHRKRRRAGIPIWRVRDRIEAARGADAEAEESALAEGERRAGAQRAEQARLDALWAELGQARARVEDELVLAVAAERERREAERRTEQARLDEEWDRLCRNEPEATMTALERAFADNEAPAAPIDCEGERATVVMEFQSPEAILPERKPARTPTGKPTLKKRSKTEINRLYLEALGSNVLATVKEAFAAAPGTQVVQLVAIRREVDGSRVGDLAAIYLAQFDRAHYEAASSFRDPAEVLMQVPEATLKLKGRAEQVVPIDLSDEDGLRTVLDQMADGLRDA